MLLLLLACRAQALPSLDSEPIAPDSPAPGPMLLINELVSHNSGRTPSPEGQPLDWVELYNPSEQALELDGMVLSDDYTDKRKAPLPDGLRLEPGELLVLWLSPDGDLPVGLSSDGEGVGVFLDGGALDWVLFPALQSDQATRGCRTVETGRWWRQGLQGSPMNAWS